MGSLVAPEPPRERLVHHRDRTRAWAVRGVDRPAVSDRNPHEIEVPAAHPIDEERHRLSGRRNVPVDSDLHRRISEEAQWDERRNRGAARSREPRQPLEHAIDEDVLGVLTIEMRELEVDRRNEDLRRIPKAAVDALELVETPKEQAARDEHRQRERKLGADQHAAQPAAAAAAAARAASGERGANRHTRRPHRRRKAEQENSRHPDPGEHE